MKKLCFFAILFILSIKINAEQANNACATATINFELGGAASNLETICTTEDTFVDLWYNFTLTESGSIQITNAGFYDGFELYDACAGTQIGYFATVNGDFNNLIAGIYLLT